MLNWLQEHMQHSLPFFLATGQTQKLSLQRIVEAVIIGAIAGGVSVYGITQVILVRVDALEKRYEEHTIKLDAVAMRQAGAISERKAIEAELARRVDHVERDHDRMKLKAN